MFQLAAGIALLLGAAASSPGGPIDTRPAGVPEQWVAVTAPGLRSAIEPLCEYRRRQGMHVTVINTAEVSGSDLEPAKLVEHLRERIRSACKGWPGATCVLLVGAATADPKPESQQFLVPALSGTVARMIGEPTDNGYGCLDDRLLPTVAVGRFPARTVDEARLMVAKTLAWEKDRQTGNWKRHITLLAGTPSYNYLVDTMVEKLAMSHLGSVSPAWSMRAIYHNPNSAYCLPEDLLADTARRYLGQGQAFAIYLGHSGADGFWWSFDDMVSDSFLGREFWSDIAIPHGAGIFATFGCNGCQLAGGDGEGYGVFAARSSRGPVAVIGAHGATNAAMSMLMSEGLLRNLPNTVTRPRLGEVWLGMKRHLAEGYLNPLVFHALDRVDGSPGTTQEVQRLEHLEMYVLLGDPAIRLPAMSGRMKLSVSGPASPGKPLDITVTADPNLQNAVGRLTLERPRTSTPQGLQHVPADAPREDRDRIRLANHERSNRLALAEKTIKLEDRVSHFTLDVPAGASWPKLHVRLYAATDDAEGIGYTTVEVRPQTTQSAPTQ